jgi:chromosome segregation ATPase
MTSINDETTPGRSQQGLDLRMMTKMNLAYDGLEDERNKSHDAKANDQQEIFNSLSDGSSVGQKLVEKSIQYAELKQENDDLRYKLEEADRKHELVEEERAALYNMVHSLQQELDGCAMDEEHKTTIEKENIVITSQQSQMQGKSIENERDEYKRKCDKFQREKDGLVDRGREREVRHSLSLRRMKSMIDQVEETNELLSQKCETLNEVIQELEGEKALQEDKIEALETQFQDFNTSRLEKASRGPERGPYYEDTWRKISGDDDGFRGRDSAADILCLGPQQEAKEEEDQTSSPSARSGTYTTQSKHVQKHQQEEDDTVSSTSFDSHDGRIEI